MEEKIKVAIAGFHNETAMAIARAVCESPDMELMKHGLSEPDFPNRHLQIACVYMELYNQERKPLFFKNVKPDILVDCLFSNDTEHAENLALFSSSEIPAILTILRYEGHSVDIEAILDDIRLSYKRRESLKTA